MLSPASKKPAIIRSPVSMTPAINPCLVVDTVDKFLDGVNDTGKQLLPGTTTPVINFFAGDNDTGEKFYCR